MRTEREDTLSPAPPGVLLRVRDLAVSYACARDPGAFAVREASFDVEPGQVTVIAGESGSGKTSTALAVMRLLPSGTLVSGAIQFRDRDLLSMNESELAKLRGSQISYISQELSDALNPVLRVGFQVAQVWSAHHGGGRAIAINRAAAVLERTGLTHSAIFRAFPHQLSGGQMQRVLLARAIVCGPSLIVADEPTSALDAVTQTDIMSLLLRLKRESRMGMLFITHSLPAVAALADRLIVMYRGRIVEAGPFSDVCRSPRHPYTRLLLEHARAPHGAHRPVPAADAGECATAACAFEPLCPDRTAICSERSPLPVSLDNSREVRCFLYGR